jgi:prepilin-type N-terminal cleavage/methylation domain-containing protein
MKKTKGFTLVELIVVIAIIGVLAAMLVPAMMGWITKANMRNANTGAKEIFRYAQAIAAELEPTPFAVEKTSPLFTKANGTGPKYGNDIIASDESNPVADADGGVGVAGNTFQSEVYRKIADKKGAMWAVQFNVDETSPTTEVATVLNTFYCDNKKLKYVGTYPVVVKSGKNTYVGSSVKEIITDVSNNGRK